ncbi:hypothetical protein HYS00_00200 [Candidatus Microgenomates bacterium]|nr:hypothetical protein [Candidatus Microgenomates bacterium]
MVERLTNEYSALGVGLDRTKWGGLRKPLIDRHSVGVFQDILTNPYVFFSGIYATQSGSGLVTVQKYREGRYETQHAKVPDEKYGEGYTARLSMFLHDSLVPAECPDLWPAKMYLVDQAGEEMNMIYAYWELRGQASNPDLQVALDRLTGVIIKPRTRQVGRRSFSLGEPRQGLEIQYLPSLDKLPNLLGLIPHDQQRAL